MDFAHKGTLSAEEWRRRGRAEVQHCLSFTPKPVPLDLKIHSTVMRMGYRRHSISFSGTDKYRVPGFLLVPDGKGPFPGLVALHDHGGYYYFGKEKIVDIENPHPSLVEFKQEAYEGRSFADELARRGFVVIVTDAFYWGERRLHYEDPPKDYQKRLSGQEPHAVQYVDAFNGYMEERTSDLNTALAFAGIHWLGIINHDDRRSLDVLASLPEVDKKRLGCIGLSGGGFRSTYLAGMDARIHAAVIVGWMSTLPSILDIEHSTHAGLYDAFGLHGNLDHPDVASLAAPDCAMFVQSCSRDRLFTPYGMEEANSKIRTVYETLGHPERFRATFYDVRHRFTIAMQEEAFTWLEKWLK